MDFVIKTLCADIDANTGIDPIFDDIEQAVWHVHVYDEMGELMELEYTALGEAISFCYFKDESNKHFFEAEEMIRAYLRSIIEAHYIVDGETWTVKRAGNNVLMFKDSGGDSPEYSCSDWCVERTVAEFKALNPKADI